MVTYCISGVEAEESTNTVPRACCVKVYTISLFHTLPLCVSVVCCVFRNYLDTLLDLPWSSSTTDTLDLATARATLDADHYGLQPVSSLSHSFTHTHTHTLIHLFTHAQHTQTHTHAHPLCLKVKKRVLEYLAVCQLTEGLKGPILCLVGAPGVGKTSIGRSVAKTLGRKFHRFGCMAVWMYERLKF